jgi:predicted nucleic acid-binding protein
MTGEVIFVDSSVFLAFFVDDIDVFGKLKDTPVTSTNVIEETCKYYGIKKIATFDEDFKRVDFLEVVELDDS